MLRQLKCKSPHRKEVISIVRFNVAGQLGRGDSGNHSRRAGPVGFACFGGGWFDGDRDEKEKAG